MAPDPLGLAEVELVDVTAASVGSEDGPASNHVAAAFDYNGFWVQAWRRANVSKHGELTRRLRPVAVYVYDETTLPPTFRDVNLYDINVTMPDVMPDRDAASVAEIRKSIEKSVYGDMLLPLKPNRPWTMRHHTGVNLAAMLYHRLANSRVYRTRDPKRADLFFVPMLANPKNHAPWHRICALLRAQKHKWLEDFLARGLPHLNARNAHRHMIVFSKEHVVGGEHDANCSGWFQKPVGLFSQFIRIAYSHAQPAALRRHAYWKADALNESVASRLYEDPDGDYPNLVSVPYPTGVHAMGAGGGASIWREGDGAHQHEIEDGHLPWDTSERRAHTACYVGNSFHGDVAVRMLLERQCRELAPRWDAPGHVLNCVAKNVNSFTAGTWNSIRELFTLKQDCDFCLEPAGDTPYRKSLADSIALGCIPILFHPMTDNANGWLWDGWKEAGRVLVPRDDFVAGRIELAKLLSTMPAPLVAQMKATLTKYARRFQVSLNDDTEGVGDAVHAIVTRAAEFAQSREEAMFPNLARRRREAESEYADRLLPHLTHA